MNRYIPHTPNDVSRLLAAIGAPDVESLFASVPSNLRLTRELDLPPDKTNRHGGAIALGHPIGASGAILTVKALYDLYRARGRYALVTMCIGGGQGIAAIFESMN